MLLVSWETLVIKKGLFCSALLNYSVISELQLGNPGAHPCKVGCWCFSLSNSITVLFVYCNRMFLHFTSLSTLFFHLTATKSQPLWNHCKFCHENIQLLQLCYYICDNRSQLFIWERPLKLWNMKSWKNKQIHLLFFVISL